MDADLSLEVTAPSLGGGRSEKIHEEGSDVDLKNCLLAFLTLTVKRWNLGSVEQVANLVCAQVNSASYPQRDGKCVVAYGLRGEGLVWLIRVVVCLLAGNCRVQLFADAGNGWPHSALRYH